MNHQQYPAYVARLLAQAEALCAEEFGQADAAALCYEILALFPEHTTASELIYTAFCDPQLIYENRKALSRTIDEWDDRPWQQRRRLGKSFSFMSTWLPPQSPNDEELFAPPPDIAAMLDEGQHQLMQDFLMGQTKGADVAWHIFAEAIKYTNDPHTTLLCIGYLYAEHGYFAEAVDILEILEVQFPQDSAARRLWAEARWWRDNQGRIPWVPTIDAGAGNGRRYREIMRQIDPNFDSFETADNPLLEYIPPEVANLPADFQLPTTLSPELMAQLAEILGPGVSTGLKKGPVDWGFLDKYEQGDLSDIEIPTWAQYILLDLDDPKLEIEFKRFLLSFLANPPQADDEEDSMRNR